MTTLVTALPSMLRGRATNSKRKYKIPSWLPRAFAFGVVGMVLATAIAYVLQVNRISERGFEVRALEQRIREMKEQQSSLEAEIRSLESLANVTSKIQALGMVQTGETQFVDASAVAVANR